MSNTGMTDADIRDIFETTRVIALVGASSNPERPSNYVGAFLQQKGYRVIPVNPGLAGQEINGETVYGALADIPVPVDMIDIFRAAEHVPGVVDEALKMNPRPKTIWMQLGIVNEEAAAAARAAGLRAVQDRCPRIDMPRLGLTGPKA